jgi:hypothetical protein
VKSNADKGISSAHCPSCGAPESDVAGNACGHCGTVLNDGSTGWVLADVVSAHGAEARSLLDRAARGPDVTAEAVGAGGNGDAARNGVVTPSSEGLLSWMVNLSAADGDFADRERAALSRVASRGGVSAARLTAMIDASRGGRVDAPQPADASEARAWLAELATVALADGRLTRPEYNLLKAVGVRAGFTEADIRLLLKRQRAQLYADAKSALRSDGQ